MMIKEVAMHCTHHKFNTSRLSSRIPPKFRLYFILNFLVQISRQKFALEYVKRIIITWDLCGICVKFDHMQVRSYDVFDVGYESWISPNKLHSQFILNLVV
jgi:hypothetical protein